jgi:hypothetical protein
MNERDVAALLRSLDEQAPSAEFAERLYRTLTESGRPGEGAVKVLDPGAADGWATPSRRRRTVGARWRLAVASAGVVLLGGLLAWIGTPGDEPVSPGTTPSGTTSATTAPEIDAEAVGDVIRAPDGMGIVSAAFDGSRFWVIAVANPPLDIDEPREQSIVFSLDPLTGAELTKTPLSDGPFQIDADPAAGVWVAHWPSGRLTRLDPVTGAAVAQVEPSLPFAVGSGPEARRFVPSKLLVAEGSVWLLTARGALARIDPAANEVTRIYELGTSIPGDVAISGGDAWLVMSAGDPLVRLDLESGSLETIVDVRTHSDGVLALNGSTVYIAGDTPPDDPDASSRVTRIDTTSSSVTDTRGYHGSVRFIGWVDGAFGVLDSTGTLHSSAPDEELALRTNWEDNWAGAEGFVTIGVQTWTVDRGAGYVLRRLRITGTLPPPLPIAIPDEFEPRPVPSDLALSPDWEALDPGPPAPQWPNVAQWTGDEIVLWGGEPGGSTSGAAYAPDTGTWRQMAEAPIASVGDAVSSVWTGRELIIWAGGRAHAWQPSTNAWRTIEDWPLQPSHVTRAVWTGSEIIDVDARLAVDPESGSVRPIAAPPAEFHERSRAVWADGLAVVVPNGPSYDAAADEWIPSVSSLTPLATSGVWTGTEVFAADYEMRAAGFDPDTRAWTAYPPVPLRFYECQPRAHAVNGRPVVEHCAGYALWSTGSESWLPITAPSFDAPQMTISTGEHLYAWTAEGLYRLDPAVLESGPRRLAMNTSILDIPAGWELIAVTGSSGTDDFYEASRIRVELAHPDGGRCTVTGTHGDAEAAIRSALGHEAVVVAFDYAVGGDPVEGLSYSAAGEEHLLWPTGSTDVVDVACRTPEVALDIARHVWTPWQ